MTAADLNVAFVAARLGRTRARLVAAILDALAVALAAMWIYLAVTNAVTGQVPTGSRHVETETIVHLGMALDLI